MMVSEQEPRDDKISGFFHPYSINYEKFNPLRLPILLWRARMASRFQTLA
jgi:hypothetical protein